jgi:magnesium transporter
VPDSVEIWEQIASIVEKRDAASLGDLLADLSPADIARAVSRLEEDDRVNLLTLLTPEEAADIIDELPDAQGADILEDLPAEDAAKIIAELESDEQADMLGEIEDPEAEAILREMAPADAATARELLAYDPDTAGGLMTARVLRFRETQSVNDVIEDLRAHGSEYSDYGVQYVYVCDDRERLTGVVRLRDLLLSSGDTRLGQIMIPDPKSLTTDTPLLELEQFFDRHDFIGVPIVEPDGTLAGVVDRGDVEEAHGENVEQTYLRSSGIVGGEELRSMPVASRASRRLSWLAATIVLNVMAALVIAFYEETLEAWIALAVFLPLISNMSGSSGNQALAVSIRELAMGIIEPRDYFLVVRKELAVGLAIGLALGVSLSLIGLGYSMLTGDAGRAPYFGVVVGGALALTTLIAVALGGVMPLLMRRLGVDPAIGSGPLLMTISDMCAFFVTLSLATFVMRFLP